ncbi:MAG: M23 family metallopeptidase [Acidobacteria bacterium]|nr:M23 family metallopeptidase [Acidobacteriota bacterium]
MQVPLTAGTATSSEGRPAAANSSTPPASPPSVGAEPPPQEEPGAAIQSAPSPEIPSSLKLVIPVSGIKPNQLRDTFNESRSDGRAHNAIDIMVARGTSVLAATDGKIIKLFTSERGGIAIYQLSTDEKLVLYYAHLERYADGLAEGHLAKQGEVIGYVGDTGNAGAGNYHLHFALWNITDPKHYWNGVNINPYPLLRESQ